MGNQALVTPAKRQDKDQKQGEKEAVHACPGALRPSRGR
jgi:hypothetical protein